MRMTHCFAPALLFLLLAGAASAADIYLASCAALSSGNNYYLTADISGWGSNCFTTDDEDSIVFDCQGHTIDGVWSGNAFNIYDSSGITIRNCVITDFQYAMRFIDVSSSAVSGIYVSDSSKGIYLSYSDGNTIMDVTSSDNGRGIYLAYSDSNSFADISISSSILEGVYLSGSSGNSFTDVTTSDNGIMGIYLEDGSSDNYFESVENELGYSGTSRKFYSDSPQNISSLLNTGWFPLLNSDGNDADSQSRTAWYNGPPGGRNADGSPNANLHYWFGNQGASLPSVCAGIGEPCPDDDACCAGICSVDIAGLTGVCCIPSASAIACNSGGDCCSGKCDGGSCVDLWGCGHACSASPDCGSSCPICASPSGGGSATCLSCIPSDSTTACSAGSECCSGICSSLTSRCVPCLSASESCSINSDCCSGRCDTLSLGGAKACADAYPSCGLKGAACSALFSCCASPPSASPLFCDYLNPNPGQGGSAGSCESCVPSGLACNGTIPCCDSGYSCRSSQPLGGGTYCLANLSAAAKYIFPNWVQIGNASFTQASSPVHSGSSAVEISGSSSSYIYNSALLLKNSTTYLLEFWSRGPGTGSGVRYAIYDPSNDAYLSQSGTWVLSPRQGGYENPVILNSSLAASSYARHSRMFTTLDNGVSQVQVRFYPGTSGPVYLDDVSVAEAHDFSMLAWVKPASPQSNGAGIFYQMGSEAGEAQGFNWSLGGSNALTMGLYSSNLSGGRNLTPSLNLSGQAWQLVGLSVDRDGNYSAYLNGKKVSSAVFSLWRLNNTAQFYLGSRGAGGTAYAGLLDEARFYRRALSPQEMLDHYNGIYQGSCSATLDVAYYAPGAGAGSLNAYYNAYLRLRKLEPDTLLSMPFDVRPPANELQMIADYSPSRLHGTAYGSNWTAAGHTGGAYNVTNKGAVWVDAPVVAGTGEFTVSAWVYSYSDPLTSYIMGNADLGNQDGMLIGAFSGYPLIYAYNDSVVSTVQIPQRTWTHLAASRERGGTGRIYINCVSAATIPARLFFDLGRFGSGNLSGPVGSNAYFYIGSPLDAMNVGYNGIIDEVRVFGRALTGDEVCGLYRDRGLMYNGTLVASGS